MKNPIKIAPSILTLEYHSKPAIFHAIQQVRNADFIHFDVMDGLFVDNKTFGPDLVQSIETNGLIKDVHLMVAAPEEKVGDFIEAGAGIISFHVEASRFPKKLITHLKNHGVKAGLALNPETPLKKIKPFLDYVDLVLIMTVPPGRGGQNFQRPVLEKIRNLRKMKPSLDLEVDGGINEGTARDVVEAGANILVSGSYIFSHPKPKEAVDILRNA